MMPKRKFKRSLSEFWPTAWSTVSPFRSLVKRYARQISLNGSWKFLTDPDGMGDRYPDDAVAAYKEDCRFFDPGYDDRDWGEIAVPACWQAQGHDNNGAAWSR